MEKVDKFHADWEFFVDENKEEKYAHKCSLCTKTCKQSYRVTVVGCPLFERAEKVS